MHHGRGDLPDFVKLMGRSVLSGSCGALPLWLTPDFLFSVGDTICGALDIGINIFFYIVLSRWVPPCVQVILLLGMFALVLLVIGELQPSITSKPLQTTLKHGVCWLLSLLGPLL